MTRRLEYTPIVDLVPARQNPKRHDLAALGASIGRFGYVEPVVVDERTGRLVAGHGRLEELQALLREGRPPPPGIEVDEFGAWMVPVVRGWASTTEAEADAYLVASNRTTELGGWDDVGLAALLEDLSSTGDLVGTGYDDDSLAALLEGLSAGSGPGSEGPTRRPSTTPTLADRFLVPPFSILDARQGYWQDRKRAWLALGIRSELGRGDLLTYTGERSTGEVTDRIRAVNAGRDPVSDQILLASDGRRPNVSPGGSPRPAAQRGPDGRTQRGDGAGRALRDAPGGGGTGVWLRRGEEGETTTEGLVADRPLARGETRRAADQRSNLTGAPALPEWADNGTEYMSSGTSIFDPVLCELAYRWFCPEGGAVLDPFAGGSVRGIVAGRLGHPYVGVDLSPAQVAANSAQAPLVGDGPEPRWVVGDSRRVEAAVVGVAEPPVDLVFSCPPYFDLEVYTDNPADLSQAPDLDAFVDGLAEVLTGCAALLARDRFVVLVMGEARDRAGDLYGLIPGTVEAARRAGLSYYNEAILVTMVGSLPLRAGRQFAASRKLGRTHQTVLVFVKGDGRAAADACGEVGVIGAVEALEAVEAVVEEAPVVVAPIPATVAAPEVGETVVEGGRGLTPIERWGDVLVKRDDLFFVAGQSGGKARTCLGLMSAPGVVGVVTAGSRHSPQVEIVAGIAHALGLPCAVHVPTGPETPALAYAASQGAEVVRHAPGYNNVIIARARAMAAERGWLEVPFGMECAEAVEATGGQAQRLLELGEAPARLVVPVGSGMTLAGIVSGLEMAGLRVPVLGVVVGADPAKRLAQWAPSWSSVASLVSSPLDYGAHAPVTRLGGLDLDPVYEAKCLPFLAPGDLLWVVGRRRDEGAGDAAKETGVSSE